MPDLGDERPALTSAAASGPRPAELTGPGGLVGCRVFFTLRGRALLKSYWGHRWDHLAIREAVTTTYTPKYHVESQHISDRFVRLRGLPLLWYRGLFSVGRHTASGRFLQVPLPDRLTGLGPRQLVFPVALLDRLAALTLIGGAHRYALADGVERELDLETRPHALEAERVVLRVDELTTVVPPPLVHGTGRWSTRRPFRLATPCLHGEALTTRIAGRRLTVPLGEVCWQELTAKPQPRSAR